MQETAGNNNATNLSVENAIMHLFPVSDEGLVKRNWNNNFQAGYGKRAWNNFNGAYGKRALTLYEVRQRKVLLCRLMHATCCMQKLFFCQILD